MLIICPMSSAVSVSVVFPCLLVLVLCRVVVVWQGGLPSDAVVDVVPPLVLG